MPKFPTVPSEMWNVQYGLSTVPSRFRKVQFSFSSFRILNSLCHCCPHAEREREREGEREIRSFVTTFEVRT
jgi:hypothetical protein